MNLAKIEEFSSKHKIERGKYIRLKMHYFILVDLGKEKINAEQAGNIADLMDGLETAGTTHCQDLAQNEYYIKAIAAWIDAKKIQRERFAKSKSL